MTMIEKQQRLAKGWARLYKRTTERDLKKAYHDFLMASSLAAMRLKTTARLNAALRIARES